MFLISTVLQKELAQFTIVKPKQTGSCGRGVRNEHMSNTNPIYPNNSRDVYFYIYWVSAYMGQIEGN